MDGAIRSVNEKVYIPTKKEMQRILDISRNTTKTWNNTTMWSASMYNGNLKQNGMFGAFYITDRGYCNSSAALGNEAIGACAVFRIG